MSLDIGFLWSFHVFFFHFLKWIAVGIFFISTLHNM